MTAAVPGAPMPVDDDLRSGAIEIQARRRLDAEFGVQVFFHSFEMLLNGSRLALGGECFHRQPVHVFAKRISCQRFAGVPQRIGPVFF